MSFSFWAVVAFGAVCALVMSKMHTPMFDSKLDAVARLTSYSLLPHFCVWSSGGFGFDSYLPAYAFALAYLAAVYGVWNIFIFIFAAARVIRH